ncbi:hypothetical protein H4B97_18140 [Pseudomonas juntendi]|uniref:Uncharacterized protein n=1 Tax=Pseudomonas juntendi TaxID=2666183 RepID=A0A7W2LNY1_9PSED|nr:hypothetical protein [Pseudomonas juntendi]MBA6144365.1 hypothetical protein [Pseudomonas juntendi]
MKALEPHIDKLFDENPILSQPFVHIYYQFCLVATLQFIREKQPPHSLAIPYTFILERIKDFSPQSLESCNEYLRNQNRKDLQNLNACANLNIVIPFIRSKIYSFIRESEHQSKVDYTDETALAHEIKDIIVTHLSLPIVANQPDDSRSWLSSVINRLKCKKPIHPTFYVDYLTEKYQALTNLFIEADIIPPSFYTQIGFSSIDSFAKIRNAFVSICQTYNDITILVFKYLEVNDLEDTATGDFLLQGLCMAKLGAAKLKKLVLDITGVEDSDYDKFAEFFFSGEGKNTNLSLKFLPPFWNISDDIYFSPSLVPALLGTRNLLISIQIDEDKNAEYGYDNLISHLFEPELLKRAQKHFENHGFSTALERNFSGGEIDLMVFCKASNTILTIQAKATLYPESARMVRRLDDRIKEAVAQTIKFDKLQAEPKEKLFKTSFADIDQTNQINHIRAILTNSSFGTTFSWKLLEQHDICPINCNLLKNALPNCKTLAELPKKIEAFITEINSKIETTDSIKVFNLPGHTIHQRHVEVKDMKILYDANYWGEQPKEQLTDI